MTSTAVLGSYLNDHLAGANAGVEMARACTSVRGRDRMLPRWADWPRISSMTAMSCAGLSSSSGRPVTGRSPDQEGRRVGSREWRLAAARRSFTPRS